MFLVWPGPDERLPIPSPPPQLISSLSLSNYVILYIACLMARDESTAKMVDELFPTRHCLFRSEVPDVLVVKQREGAFYSGAYSYSSLSQRKAPCLLFKKWAKQGERA